MIQDQYVELPQCCRNCQNYEWDGDDYVTWRFCALNIRFPVKKQSCKRQKPYYINQQ